MKLKKLIVAEIVLVAVILVVVMVVVEGIPYLEASQQNSSITMYQQREFGSGSVTLARGETASTRFNYSTYDPAILVLDLTFQSWELSGNLTFYCNGVAFASIFATPENPRISLSAISVSGADLVQPSSVSSPLVGAVFTYGNEITFASDSGRGYAGAFDYEISIRGSR